MSAMPLIILVVAFGAMVVGLMQQGRTRDAWTEAANRLGMSLESTGSFGRPRMRGQFGDVIVHVSVLSTGGENSKRFTRFLVNHPPIGPVVTMTRQGMMSGFLGAFTGRKDVLVGDPLFDDRVIVHAHDDDAVREFLTPARRAAVQELLSSFDRAEITRDRIEVDRRGVSTDPNELVATVTRLVDMASVLGDVRFNTILGHQQSGHLRRAADELHDFNRGGANRFSRTLEAGAMVEAGQHAQAAEAFDELWSGQPDDPVSSGWYDVASYADPDPVSVGPVAALPQQQVVLEDVFSVDRMSWEVVEHFESTYRGLTVEWSGSVVRAEGYEQDRDFDGGPGVKAVVAVGQVGRSGIVSSEIEAVVELDAGVVLSPGQVIGFRGVLTSVDRFGRKVFVRHASLT